MGDRWKVKKNVLVPRNVWRSKPYGFSQAILCEAKKLFFISGQVGIKPSGKITKGVSNQIRQAFENLMNVLKEANATFDHIVKITAYLTDIEDLPKFNEIKSQYIKNQYPAATVVGINGLARKELKVEIEAIAIL